MLAEGRVPRNPHAASAPNLGAFGEFSGDSGSVRAGIGSSTRPEVAGGVEEAVEAALAGLGGAPADAVIVAATTALGSRALPDLVARAGVRLDCEAWIGASAEGVLLADQEIVRLDVAVDEVLRVHVLDAVDHLFFFPKYSLLVYRFKKI